MKNLLPELRAFFAAAELPTYHIKLNVESTIINPALFVSSHLEMAEAAADNIAIPYIERLVSFREIISEIRAKPH